MAIHIYADVLFLTNFMMDYVLLCATAFFAKKKHRPLRIVCASTLGALFAVVLFFLPVNAYLLHCLVFLTSLAMVSLSCNEKRFLVLFKQTAIFYMMSFVLGGMLFSILSLTRRNESANVLLRGGMLYIDINAYTVFFVFLLTVLLVRCGCSFLTKLRVKGQYLYTVTIEKNGKSVTGNAFFDTGNFLKEPFSQKSVLLAEWSFVFKLFEETCLESLVKNDPKAFCFIPCRSLGGSGGIYGFAPDRVLLDETPLEDAVLIGIYSGSLDREESYNMLLPNDLLKMPRAERM